MSVTSQFSCIGLASFCDSNLNYMFFEHSTWLKARGNDIASDTVDAGYLIGYLSERRYLFPQSVYELHFCFTYFQLFRLLFSK